jgi:class 3 adenylate cyclase/CHASE2 domain-containing sensor protein
LYCSGFFVYLSAVQLKRATSAPVLIAVCVIALACVFEFSDSTFFKRLELLTYDTRVRLTHRLDHSSPVATNLAFVDINDYTISLVNAGLLGKQYGLYWPRHVYGTALKELSFDDAKAVAFDVIFAERRPDHMIDVIDREANKTNQVSSDSLFAAELRNAGMAILAADRDVMPEPYFAKNAYAVANITVDRDVDGVLRRDIPYKDYRNWHSLIRRVAAQKNLLLSNARISSNQIVFIRPFYEVTNGVKQSEQVVVPLDADGMMDTTNLGVIPNPPAIPEKIIPLTMYRAWSLGLILAARELKLNLDDAKIEPGRIVLHGDKGVTRTIPLESDGSYYIEWSMGANDDRLTRASFDDVLQCRVDREKGEQVDDVWSKKFVNKLVIIGSTATGNDLADLGTTSLDKTTFMVSKHWNVANSIITGRFVKSTPFPLKLVLIVLMGTLASVITWRIARPFHGLMFFLCVAAAYVAGAFLLHLEYRIWVPIILPVLFSGLVTTGVTLAYRVLVEQTERQRIKSVFSKVVSPVIVNELLKTEGVRVDGVRRRITVYFADVRGFTELTDTVQQQADAYLRDHKLSPDEAEAYLSEQARQTLNTVSTYLSIIADTIKQRNGTFDKYIGDCVMAFWGAPISNPRHAVDCVMAAIDAQRGLAELNVQRKADNVRRAEENVQRAAMNVPAQPMLPVLSMGSGINTGEAVVGEMGSAEQTNYTVFGREVNLASRLEGVSGHGRIIIGESTYLELKQHEPALAATCIELPPREVKGFRVAVKIYEVPWKRPGDSDTAFVVPASTGTDVKPPIGGTTNLPAAVL